MCRTRAIGLALAAALALPVALAGQAPARTRTAQQKIADALSAAPRSIAAKAAIMDWPAKEGEQPKELRAGDNGWVCFPTTPQAFESASGHDPMCVDQEWQAWADAWSKKEPPQVKKVGVAYMLMGDAGGSNTDPFATKPTADNEWITSPPHIMVLLPDTAALAGLPSDPNNGGPWVMYKGTPYAHVMVPIAPRRVTRPRARKIGD